MASNLYDDLYRAVRNLQELGEESTYTQARDEAQTAAGVAQAAASSAKQSSSLARTGIKGVYNTTADGISATNNSDEKLFYLTDYDAGLLHLYLNNNGSPEAQDLSLPGVDYVNSVLSPLITDKQYGYPGALKQTGQQIQYNVEAYGEALPWDCTITHAEFVSGDLNSSAGRYTGSCSVWVCSKSGDPDKVQASDQFTRINSAGLSSREEPPEPNSVIAQDLNMPVKKGQFIAVYHDDSTLQYSDDPSPQPIYRAGGAEASFKAGDPKPNFSPQIRITVTRPLPLLEPIYDALDNIKQAAPQTAGAPLRVYSAAAIQPSEIYADDRVYNWIDQSPYNCHASVIYNSVPKYVENGLNGRPSLRFVESSNNIRVMTGAPVIEPPYTLWAIAKPNSPDGVMALLTDQVMRNDSVVNALFAQKNGQYGYRIDATDYLGGTASAATHLFLLECPDEGDAHLEVDGQTVASGGRGPSIAQYLIGGHESNNNDFYGDLTDLQFASGILSPERKQSLLEWAQNTYGIGA